MSGKKIGIYLDGKKIATAVSCNIDYIKHFAIALETTDDIIKGRKYELIESESMGHYIIDESGEETYYYHSSLKICL